jgi:hypothetical protein
MGEWWIDLIGVPIENGPTFSPGDPYVSAYAESHMLIGYFRGWPDAGFAYADVDGRATLHVPIVARAGRPGSPVFVERKHYTDGRILEAIMGTQVLTKKGAFDKVGDDLWDAFVILRGKASPAGRKKGAQVPSAPEELVDVHCYLTDEHESRPGNKEPAEHFYVPEFTIKRRISDKRKAGIVCPPTNCNTDDSCA